MIRAAMNQILLRILLLVVFFNTAVGMPLHAAEHLHGPAQVCGSLQDGEAAASGDCTSEEHGSAHGRCVWCSSHAQLATAIATGDVAALPLLAPTAVFDAVASVAWVPQPERWRYAARDPPSMN